MEERVGFSEHSLGSTVNVQFEYDFVLSELSVWQLGRRGIEHGTMERARR